jgi:5-formyltetrahydrofolate cyclo-ligase
VKSGEADMALRKPRDDDPRAAIRRTMRKRRAALSATERLATADAIAEVLGELPELLTDQYVAGYWAVGGEVSLHRVVPPLLRREQTYLLPVLSPDGDPSLRFAPWRPGAAVAPNRYGIPEPQCAPEELVEAAEIELVLLPLVAFDRRGHRFGTGAGYYDRTFAFLREVERPALPLLVGVAYAFQEVEALPAEAWDIPLDFVATEHELIECTHKVRKKPS